MLKPQRSDQETSEEKVVH